MHSEVSSWNPTLPKLTHKNYLFIFLIKKQNTRIGLTTTYIYYGLCP